MKHIALSVIFSVICFIFLLQSGLIRPSLTTPSRPAETTFERVIRTGTLNCGYGIAPPYVEEDPNTGKVTGLFVDIMEEIGKVLNIKIVWADNIAWDRITPELQARKIDAICSGLWIAGSRGRAVAYTKPILFNAVDIFVRAGDTRFDHHPELLNNPKITLATDDGGLSEEIAKNDFPLAKQLSSPQMAPPSDLLMNVITRKADATFANEYSIIDFEKHNKGSFHKVILDRPIRMYHNALGVNIHDQDLRDMLNAAITELEGAGKIQTIMKKYKDAGLTNLMYEPARAYEIDSSSIP